MSVLVIWFSLTAAPPVVVGTYPIPTCVKMAQAWRDSGRSNKATCLLEKR